MKPAHAIALALIPFLMVAGAIVATVFQRVRDLFFFAMVSLAVFADRMDVNFFSEAWYRGTTRGVQVTLIELLAFGLLVGCWMGRRDGKRPWFWPPSLGLMLAFFFYALLSVVVSEPKIFGVFELSKMVGSILVFLSATVYVRSRREWTLLMVALGCTVAAEGAWAVKQHFITHLERAEGTLGHANSLSMYLCMTVPLLIAGAFGGWSPMLKRFCGVCAAFGSIGLLLTFSRAGIPVFFAVAAGTAVACASWRLTPRRIVVRALCIAAAAAMIAAFWGQIQARYAESTLEEEYFDPTLAGRGIYLRLAREIVQDHFFGVGLNNWSYQVSRTYGPRLGFRFSDYDYLISIYGSSDDSIFADSYLAAPAHNLGALTLGELGVPGLVIFTLLWLRWFGMGARFLWLPRDEPMRTMGVGIFFCICGIFGQSFTEWVYRQTPIHFTFFILIGALASLSAARRRARAQERPGMSAPEASAAEEEDVPELPPIGSSRFSGSIFLSGEPRRGKA